ncbi:chromosome partitioning protein [Micromonospora zhanjiangensis]
MFAPGPAGYPHQQPPGEPGWAPPTGPGHPQPAGPGWAPPGGHTPPTGPGSPQPTGPGWGERAPTDGPDWAPPGIGGGYPPPGGPGYGPPPGVPAQGPGGYPAYGGPGYPPPHAPGHPDQGGPGYPPPHAPGHPDQGGPGYPPPHAPGHPDQGGPGYPPPHTAGHPGQGGPGYPPPHAAGYPDQGGPGYPPPNAGDQPPYGGPGYLPPNAPDQPPAPDAGQPGGWAPGYPPGPQPGPDDFPGWTPSEGPDEPVDQGGPYPAEEAGSYWGATPAWTPEPPPWPDPATAAVPPWVPAPDGPQPPPGPDGGPGPAGQPEAPGVVRMPPPDAGYPDQPWNPDTAAPTADEFARRRAARPAEPIATMGLRAAVNKTTRGLIRIAPSQYEQDVRKEIETVRRNFGGLRQVTVVNPKGGAGKTVAILLLAMTFGQRRGGYVLAWDNNETQGTLGMRAQQDFHSRTVRDLLRDLPQFQGAHGRIGDLSQYVRSQGEGMFDVLASDESATGGEMLTAYAFAEIREVVSRFYKLIFVDTGNNVRAQNWQAAIDATDQLVITMSARNDSAETAARMLDHLEQSGRQRLVRQAVTVVSMPPSRKEIDLPAIQQHFAARTRAVLLAPYERLIDTGEPIRYGQLSSAARDAWLKIAAAVAEGL